MALGNKRLLRAGALFVTFAGVERAITMARGGKAESWNFLTAGALTSGLFGFASGQLRRGLLIGGFLSLAGLPVYLVVTGDGIDAAAERLAAALGVQVPPQATGQSPASHELLPSTASEHVAQDQPPQTHTTDGLCELSAPSEEADAGEGTSGRADSDSDAPRA